jgi:hypothetical protein
VLSSLLLSGGAAPPAAPVDVDIGAYVSRFLSAAPGKDSTTPRLPTAAEVRVMRSALQASVAGRLADAQGYAGSVSYTVEAITDAATGQRLFVVAPTDTAAARGWGLFIVAPRTHRRLVVEVPHPIYDQNTAATGLAAFHAGHGAALLVAGAHRYSGDGDTFDVAHDPRTMFAAASQVLAGQGDIVLQPHGFSSSSHPGYAPIVLSAGTSSVPGPVTRLSTAFEADGFSTCVYDGSRCSALGATTNVEGDSARAAGATFVHLEMSEKIRDDAAARAQVGRIAGAVLSNSL